MKKIITYLNPIEHLGDRRYSIVFPLFANLGLVMLSELYAYAIAKNPMVVGNYIIFLNVAFIIYFSFRDGIGGGVIATISTIGYYFYIIYTRHYHGSQLGAGIDTTIILAILYLFLAIVIGWLKQTIDGLIEREADEKIRLQTILQQLPVGVVITDHKGRVTQANKKLQTLLGTKIPIGYTLGEENNLVESTQDNKPTTASQSPVFQSLRTGKPVIGKEFTLHREDGKDIHVQVSASTIVNKNKKVIAAASIVTDITQQKELEARKDDFVNMASHELKTPITSMKLYIDSLLSRIRSYNDERSMKIVSNIKTQTERLQELVNDLLDVSRLQTGKLTFTKEQFRLDTLIGETIDGLQGTTKNHKIMFDKPFAISVYADRFRIYQVLTNLITNAMKYSGEGKEIHVRVKRPQGKALVCVQDFGIGIAKGEQKKIFDRLYQVTGDTEKTFPGFGMGLYISKEIIRRHKGAIWVESEKGKGSTFYFSLPLQKKAV